jgi:cation:H+ antiporter
MLYGLIRAADLIEDGFVYIAKKLRVNEFLIGFVVLSFISQLPELFVVFNASDEVPELSIGNLLGGCLILLTLVLGTAVLKFNGIELKGKFREHDIIVGIIVIFLTIVSLADGALSELDGVLLITSYLVYVIHLWYRFKVHRRLPSRMKPINLNIDHTHSRANFKMFIYALFGSVLILICSSLIVQSVVALGDRVNVNESLVGLFILAVGTNIPEMAILYRAKSNTQKNLVFGNLIGAASINVFIMGLLALLSGGVVLNTNGGENYIALIPVMVILSLALGAFLIFSWTGRKITKIEGAMLIGFYISLIITEGILLL